LLSCSTINPIERGFSMLSDTLSDLLCDIETHQDEFPEIYCDNRSAIDKVRMVLSSLCCYFDTPPILQLAAPLNNLLDALSHLDTSAVMECIDDITHRCDALPTQQDLCLPSMLHAALDDIARYQEVMPDIYGHAEAAINNASVVITALADYCLFLPASTVKPLLISLMHSIRSLDISRIDASRIRLYDAWDTLPKCAPHAPNTACPAPQEEEPV
jgi:hypothetical protein